MGNDDLYDGFDFEDEGASVTVADLRKWGKSRDKAAKDAEKKLAEANAKLTEVSLKDVLQEKGLNPALSKFIVKDGVDATKAEAVDAWLTENGALFGYKPNAKTSEETGAQDERAAAFQQMQESTANAIPPTKMSDIVARMDQVKPGDIDAMNALLAEAQRAAPMQKS